MSSNDLQENTDEMWDNNLNPSQIVVNASAGRSNSMRVSNGEIVVLSPSSNRDELAVVSKSVLEPADIYSPPRVMRSIQYLMEQGVIRIWNDAILSDKRNNGLPSPKTEISKG